MKRVGDTEDTIKEKKTKKGSDNFYSPLLPTLNFWDLAYVMKYVRDVLSRAAVWGTFFSE